MEGQSSRDPLHLANGSWGLPRAKLAAARIFAEPSLLKPLVNTMLSGDDNLRWHAADTTRRVAERQPELLAPYTEILIGLFSESGSDNWRTRAHLGLVVARIAHSHSQRIRAAGLLLPLYYDPSNVVRCTAIEGLGILAQHEPSLRPQFEALAEEALAAGTLAMKNRAQHALARLNSDKRVRIGTRGPTS
jgi:HEAT repeat protein